MSMSIAITGPGILVEGEIEETRSGTQVMAALPLEEIVELWGGEISLRTPVRASADEGATYELNVGDVGYCPSTGSIVIYHGATPLSQGSDPVARFLVNRVGRITEGIEQLWRVRPGTKLRIAWF